MEVRIGIISEKLLDLEGVDSFQQPYNNFVKMPPSPQMQNKKDTFSDFLQMHGLDNVFDDFSAFNFNTASRKNPFV